MKLMSFFWMSPHFWTKELDELGIDPCEHDAAEMDDDLENIETAEDFDPTKTDSTSKKRTSSTKSGGEKSGEHFLFVKWQEHHSRH